MKSPRTRSFVPPAVLALALCGLLAASACRRAPALCAFCQMPIPAETAARVIVKGEERQVCDPRCALTHQTQTGERATVTVVTDFETGAALEPSQAFYLTGSDTAPDVGPATLRRPAERMSREWHRCLPSVLAFATKGAAARHQARHGGRVQTLAELGYDAADAADRPAR